MSEDQLQILVEQLQVLDEHDDVLSSQNPKKRKYKKKTEWTTATENLLVQMWQEKIKQLRGNRKNQHVYAEIAAELQKNGLAATAIDVKNKVHNLTARYRKEKLLIGPSGGSPSEWPLYSRLHSFLGSYRYYNLTEITCDSISACNDDASTHEDVPRKTRNRQPQYANENFFSNDEEENEEENEQEETASDPISLRRQTEYHNEGRNEYLKAMSESLKLMVEKVCELSENIQKGNSQLVQISQILRNQQRTKYEDAANDTSLSSSRKRKLSQYDPDAVDEISKFENKTILDDYLKTKELERKFMTEKHNIQMEILRLELERKRNEMEMDA